MSRPRRGPPWSLWTKTPVWRFRLDSPEPHLLPHQPPNHLRRSPAAIARTNDRVVRRGCRRSLRRPIHPCHLRHHRRPEYHAHPDRNTAIPGACAAGVSPLARSSGRDTPCAPTATRVAPTTLPTAVPTAGPSPTPGPGLRRDLMGLQIHAHIDNSEFDDDPRRAQRAGRDAGSSSSTTGR